MALLLLLLGCSLTATEYSLKSIPTDTKIIPILIIGSGPAGLMAGRYGARAKIPTVIISGSEPGGQLIGASDVENIPGIPKLSGQAIMAQMREQAANFGAQIIEDTVIKVDFNQWPFHITTQEHGTLFALSVIITTGAAPRLLGIPGEREYWGQGVSACSICDCFLCYDKHVAIVGGGDAAVEHAMNLMGYAAHITMLIRSNKMRAAAKVQERVIDHEKISILYNKEILEILGDGQSMTGLRIIDNQTGEQEVLHCDGLFLAIGHNPNSELFTQTLELLESGYIKLASRSQETSIRGIFAAGDVEDHRFRQAGIAAGHGIQAALEAIDFLREHGIDDRMIKRLCD